MFRKPPPPPPPSFPDDDDLPPPDDDELPPDDDEFPPDDDEGPPPPEENEEDAPPPEEDDYPPPPDDSFGDSGPPPEDDMLDDDAPPEEDAFDEGSLPLDDMDEPPIDDDMDMDVDDEPPLPDDEDELGDLPDEDDLPTDFDDLDAPEDPPSPEPPTKTSFVLPVRKTVSILHPKEPQPLPPTKLTGPMMDLQALTAGLTLREPPQLVRRSLIVTAPPPSVASSVAEPTSKIPQGVSAAALPVAPSMALPPLPSSAPPSTTSSTIAEEVRARAKAEGFMPCLGKFDTDPFEALFVKIDQEIKHLIVLVETGDELAFDLASKAYVFEDTVEPFTIVLDYFTNIIVFKEALVAFMKGMPEEVFFAPEDAPPPLTPPPAKPTAAAAGRLPDKGPKIEHVKGTSVEDILENDFDVDQQRQNELDAMFSVKETITMHYPPAPLRRKELVDSHIRKPKYSVRRVTLLCEWINSLSVWPHHLTIPTLHKEMCNGLLLAKLVQHLNPDVQFLHMNAKPLARKAAVENLDQALGHIYRSKSINATRIPSAVEIFEGKTNRLCVLINELYTVYIGKSLYKSAIKVLRWFNGVLRQYSRPLPDYVFEDGDLSAVWPHFQSGTALFCIFFHFFGPQYIGKGAKAVKIDPLKVCGDPKSICDYRDNLVYVFSLLDALDIYTLWTVEDWISYPDTEFMMLQLIYIYEVLRDKQCSLPPAQGQTAGITSGLNGEMLVVGVVFKDAPSLMYKFVPHTYKAVLLGHDKDSMPLLPVEKHIANPRFTGSGWLPQGMTHNNAMLYTSAQILQKEKAAQAQQGKGWNGRTTVNTAKDTHEGSHLVGLLREHHKTVGVTNTLVGSQTQAVSRNATTRRTSALQRLSTAASHDPSLTLALSSAVPQPGGGAGSPGPRGCTDQVNREVEELLAQLEAETGLIHKQIEAGEEALASKYLELEAHSHMYSYEDYEQTLRALEEERLELEEERLRVQDHHERKLAAIREKRDEAHRRNYSSQQRAFSDLAQTVRGVNQQASSAMSVSQLAASPSKTQTQMQAAKKTGKLPIKPAPPASKEEREKGWISLSSAKMNTHNYHLRNKQLAASSKFIQKITPNKLRGTSALGGSAILSATGGPTEYTPGSSLMHTPMLMHASLLHDHPADKLQIYGDEEERVFMDRTYQRNPYCSSAEEAVHDAFSRFKQRLQYTTNKWAAARSRHRPRVADILNREVRAASPEPIALPHKSLVPQAMSKEEMAYALQLRNDELVCLHFEDERRKMVLAEQSLRSMLSSGLGAYDGGASGQQLQQQAQLQQYGGGGGGGHQGYTSVQAHSPTPAPRSPSPQLFASGDAAAYATPYTHAQPSAVEIDAGYRFLSAARPLVVCDRTPKEFIFQLMDYTTAYLRGGEVRRSGYMLFAFEWKDFSAYSAEEVVAGYVLLEDVVSLTSHANASPCEPDVFSIQIKETTRGLRNAKGRTSVVVRCASQTDCLKYVNALTILLAVR